MKNLQKVNTHIHIKVYLPGIETQDRSPQTILQWHTDYFELKSPDEQPVPEGHLDPLCLFIQKN